MYAPQITTARGRDGAGRRTVVLRALLVAMLSLLNLMTLTGTIPRRTRVFFFFLVFLTRSRLHLYSTSTLSVSVFFFPHLETCARPVLHFVGWLAVACMSVCTVVLSSVSRRNSYTPVGRVREVQLGCIPQSKWSFRKLFHRAT
jgi:hypothetical protein